MQKLKAIFIIIRFPNLVFIFLTQLLAYLFIVRPSISIYLIPSTYNLQFTTLLYFSTVLIAAAGNIINDYFDMKIDTVNKPEKITIEKYFSRRRIISWHILLNILALLITFYVAYNHVKLRFISVQLLCIGLLVVYSTTFKRKLFIGNFIIALLTALTLYVVALYEPQFHLYDFTNYYSKLLWLYMLFAFFITLIREIVKDIEDVKGDMTQNCKTIPLVFGINTAKKIVHFFIFILWLFLLYSSYRFLQTNLVLTLFLNITVSLPLAFVYFKLHIANTSKHFHAISLYIKIITLLGILSMLFI